MSVTEPFAREPAEPMSRSRLRSETPPAHYWRRWVGDFEAPVADIVMNSPPPLPTVDQSSTSTSTSTSAANQPPSDGAVAPFRVLVVEDDRGQALFAQSVLHGAGMQAEVEMDPTQIMQSIERFEPDLVLMDLHISDHNGIKLTQHIRLQPHLLHLPIVFLTGDTDPERQFEVLESGADDFLSKPIRPRHLIAAVSNRIMRARQRVPLAARVLAVNPETGLPTRAYLMQELSEALESQTIGGLFFIEIIGAHRLREHYGYVNFERMMLAAWKQLSDSAAPHPVVRLTDGSFLALANGMQPSAMDGFAKQVVTQLGQLPLQARDEETLRLQGAIGYAVLPHTFSDTGSAMEATERAAMLARKQPSSVAMYQPPAEIQADTGLSLEDAQLELAFQPIVAVAGSNQAQYQVLLRMRKADGTLITAAQAVPAAELAGRIVALDQQVMERVLDLLAKQQAQGPSLRLFVSQSPRTLARDNMASWLLSEIASRKLEGLSLIIDLRLDDALIHSVTLRDFCNRMMPAGVQFCLSQYESGSEAEALLNQLPLGYLRVSRRYSAAHNDPKLSDQLREVIDMAHRHGLQVIGQQIEDPQAAATMWMGGVDFIQGDLVQRVGSDLGFDFHNAVL